MARTTSKPRAPTGEMDASVRICVLHGPEATLKRQHIDALRAALQAAFTEVETISYDGLTDSLADVLDELRSFGLMQQHKLVIVDNADKFVSDHRKSLERYVQSPSEHGTLVLRADKWHAVNLDKLIQKVVRLIKCEALSPAAATKWLTDRALQTLDQKLDPQVAKLMVDRIGVDLGRLDGELAKISLLVEPGQALTTDVARELLGRSNDEDAWAVQESVLAALAQGDGLTQSSSRAALEKVRELIDLGGQPDVLVCYFVADLMRKLHLGAAMKQQGQPPAQIARQLKLWGPREMMFTALLRKLNLQKTGQLLERIVEADARSKSGFGKATGNLECFCARLADETR
ncbi:MAG: DNA polymerase III subunit delta [Phycisphaeraceae bacterium]|nr:DNA polymerase III subunit delta [Phycisphaeraceae bacterium]